MKSTARWTSLCVVLAVSAVTCTLSLSGSNSVHEQKTDTLQDALSNQGAEPLSRLPEEFIRNDVSRMPLQALEQSNGLIRPVVYFAPLQEGDASAPPDPAPPDPAPADPAADDPAADDPAPADTTPAHQAPAGAPRIAANTPANLQNVTVNFLDIDKAQKSLEAIGNAVLRLRQAIRQRSQDNYLHPSKPKPPFL